jgi:xanthine dehydrogenase accessory factor
LLFGESPCARALAKLGEVMGYAVELLPQPGASIAARGGRVFAVVASMGEIDEDSVVAALKTQPAYLGVVASRNRFTELRETLIGRGVPAEALARIHNPAGLDIGARLPEEVALSIFAQIVQLRRAEQPQPVPVIALEVDPVCGMKVEVATARHRADHAGRTFYFCNPRCKEKFLAAPDRFLAA